MNVRGVVGVIGVACAACGGDAEHAISPPAPAEPVRVVRITAAVDTFVAFGESATFAAEVLDSVGAPVPDAPLSWGVQGQAVSVDATGRVTSRERGSARVFARSGMGADTVIVVVRQEPAGLSPPAISGALHPRGVVDLQAAVLDANGYVVERLRPAWSSSDEAVATVDDRGHALGLALGPVTFTATFDGEMRSTSTEVVRPNGGGDFRVWSADGTVIAGTLDLPPGPGPHPVMVRVHGSGPNTRASGLFLAGQVLPAGIGVMRYDKRGVGASEGFYSGVGTLGSLTILPELAADAAAWLAFLAMHQDVVPERLGLLGVSQGGWIAPLAASMSPHARYMINVVGPTITVGQQIYYQTLTGSAGGGENTSGLSDAGLAQLVRDFDGPHGFDPAPVLRDLEIPGLWVLGTKDYLVPYENTTEILTALVDELQKDYEVVTLDNATHGTRDRDTGAFVPWWDVAGGGFDWLRARGFLGG